MRTLVALITIGLSGCVSAPYMEPLEWSSLGNGCYDRGLSEVLLSPEDFGNKLSLTDIRIGRLPDTGRGPGLVVHFRRGLKGPIGQSAHGPQVFVAMGDWNKSCSVLLDESACPQAAEAYNHLASQSIPIGHAFDDPIGLTVLHGATYFLSSRDGHSNQMSWSYSGDNHPLQEALDAALESLKHCATPAIDEFTRYVR